MRAVVPGVAVEACRAGPTRRGVEVRGGGGVEDEEQVGLADGGENRALALGYKRREGGCE